jgi:MFS family permease
MKRQHYGLTLAVLAVAGLSFALLQTMVAPALPAIQREYGASTTAVTWVFTVYLLTASIATPVLGRLGDMFGKERLLVIVLLVLAAGTLIAALSHSLEMLIAGRAVQGAGGAIFPLARTGPRTPVQLGIALVGLGFVQLAVLHDAPWHIYLNSLITGAGIGLSFAGMATLIVEAVPQTQTGVATGMNTIMRSIGGALGAQISASIVGAHIASGLPTESGFVVAFVVSAAALALAFAAALLIPRRAPAQVVPHGYERIGEPARVAAR